MTEKNGEMISYCDKQAALWVVRGHKARKAAFEAEREELYTLVSNSLCEASHGSTVNDSTFNKMIRLQKMELSTDFKYIQAVEAAKTEIGADLRPVLAKRLAYAIMLNCTDRHNYPYYRLNVDFVSERDFYRRRSEFLKNVFMKI